MTLAEARAALAAAEGDVLVAREAYKAAVGHYPAVLSAPPGTVLAELDAGLVAATIVGGGVVFRR